jgi:uncharacterized membrane protein YecN with MAPEG domain
MMLPITLTIAGAAAILNFWLAVRTARARASAKVLIGDGGDPLLIARMRAHANYVEYTPFVLILLGLIELSGASATWLWVAGILYILARIAHPFGLERGTANWMRGIGIGITFLILLGLAGYALWLPYTLHAVVNP